MLNVPLKVIKKSKRVPANIVRQSRKGLLRLVYLTPIGTRTWKGSRRHKAMRLYNKSLGLNFKY